MPNKPKAGGEPADVVANSNNSGSSGFVEAGDEAALLRSLLATAVDGIVTIDERGCILSFNAAAERIFGYAPAEVLGQNVRLLMPAPYHDEHDGYLARYCATGERRIIGIGREVEARRKDGTLFPIDLAVSEVPHKGPGRRFAGILRDISDRRLVQERLNQTLRELEGAHARLIREQEKVIQAEKLSSIGLLASGVAHEVNNPLAGLMACLRMLRGTTLSDERREQYFQVAQDALERIERVVRGLLDYAKKTPNRRQPFLWVDVVATCVRLVTPAARKKNIALVQTVPEEAGAVGDRSGAVQAVMNVLLNALHATPGGGRVEITWVEGATESGLCISDTGPGIPEAELGRVCDPFYSTKPEGEGTGLGLSVTQGIMQAHGGRLEFVCPEAGGTRVTLWLPLEEADSGSEHV